jgi:HEAT repeat protein
MVKALGGGDAMSRFLAGEGLIEMGDGALAALEPLAKSPGYTPERQRAIHIIGRIGSPRAGSLLVAILEHEEDVRIRGLLCMHLGRMGTEEAVPVIGRWLLTIRGKVMDSWDKPEVLTPTYEWMRHVYALEEIGSEKGIPVLEEMVMVPNPGRGGKEFTRACQESLGELRREAAFWKAVREVAGLEREAKVLFEFCRKDTLAVMRMYRTRIVGLGTEGRWALQDLAKVDNAEVQRAAGAMLAHYDGVRRTRGIIP